MVRLHLKVEYASVTGKSGSRFIVVLDNDAKPAASTLPANGATGGIAVVATLVIPWFARSSAKHYRGAVTRHGINIRYRRELAGGRMPDLPTKCHQRTGFIQSDGRKFNRTKPVSEIAQELSHSVSAKE